MSNIVVLRNVYGKEKADCHINPMKQKNGLNYPFVKRVRSLGNGETEMILSEAELNSPESNYFIPEDMDIILRDGTTFDLDNPLQRNIWECIKNSHIIAPERGAKDNKGNLLIDGDAKRYGIAEFYIERPGAESEKRIKRIQLVTKAYTFIEEDSAAGRLTKVRLLGKSMRNAPDTDIQDYLYQRAEKDPETIIDLYTGSDTALKLMLIDAKDKHVITLQSGVWMYGDIKLGVTDEAVILFLKNPQYKNIYESVRNETYPEMVGVRLKENVVETDSANDNTSSVEDTEKKPTRVTTSKTKGK